MQNASRSSRWNLSVGRRQSELELILERIRIRHDKHLGDERLLREAATNDDASEALRLLRSDSNEELCEERPPSQL